MEERLKIRRHAFPMNQLYTVFNTSTKGEAYSSTIAILQSLSSTPLRKSFERQSIVEAAKGLGVPPTMYAGNQKLHDYVAYVTITGLCCCLSAISKLCQAICLSPQCSLKPLFEPSAHRNLTRNREIGPF
jgi:hypothetical protein